MPFGQVEALDNWEGEDGDGYVGEDVEAGVGEPGSVLVVVFDSDEFGRHMPHDQTIQAFALCIWINILDPKVADRGAREDCTEERPAGVCGNDSNQRVADPPERVLRENSEILQQDGQLGAKESRVVSKKNSTKLVKYIRMKSTIG